jgi:hypothetical protein
MHKMLFKQQKAGDDGTMITVRIAPFPMHSGSIAEEAELRGV